MHIPEFFLRELKDIDPTYRVEFDKSDGTYLIVKDVVAWIPLDNGRMAKVYGPRIVDFFEELSSQALEKLRRRKYEGRRMNIVENPKAELEYYARLNREAKAKKRELAIDMMAEGFMKAHKLATTKTFVMPSEKNDGTKVQD